MDNVAFIKDLTDQMCDKDFDLDLVERTFAPGFLHHSNGTTYDKAAYLERGRAYRSLYEHIDRPEFDELFAVGDNRVVVAYTLTLTANGGTKQQAAVMAIWTLEGETVTELREVDGPVADETDV